VARAGSVIEGLERASSGVSALESKPEAPPMNDSHIGEKPRNRTVTCGGGDARHLDGKVGKQV
jgi:hypothetical protein